MRCNPAKGRVEFVDGWLKKSSFITKDEMKACQLTRTKIQQKKKKKKKTTNSDWVGVKHLIIIINYIIIPYNLAQ